MMLNMPKQSKNSREFGLVFDFCQSFVWKELDTISDPIQLLRSDEWQTEIEMTYVSVMNAGYAEHETE